MQNLIRSREFWVMVIGVVVGIIVALVPQLAGSKEEIINGLTILVTVALLAFGGEKIAAANTSGTTKIERQQALPK